MATSENWLHPKEIRALSNADLRKYYSRARTIANKRLGRLEKAGLRPGPWTRSPFPKMSELTNGEIERELADVTRFLRSNRTTVSGERKYIKREIEYLREDRGYGFINDDNIYDFLEFMDDMREKQGAKYFDSGDAADVFKQGQRLNVPEEVLKEHFDYFVENMKKMEQVQPIKTDRAIKFYDIKRKMNRLEK